MLTACFALATGCRQPTPQQRPDNVVYADDGADGYATVRVPEGGGATVLVLTDFNQDPDRKYSIVGCDNDKTIRLLTRLLETGQPDLVVLAGDLTDTGSLNNWRYVGELAEVFEQVRIPWTFAFGDRDCPEQYVLATSDTDALLGQMPKEDLLRALRQNYPYCLASRDNCADGAQVVQLRTTQGALLHNVVCLDSVAPAVTDAQIQWFCQNLCSIRNADGDQPCNTVVRHLPLGEMYTAYGAAQRGAADAEILGGVLADVPDAPINDAFWTALRQYNTRGVLCGHNIDNDVQILYQGIHLGYVPHSGLSAPYRVGIDRDLALLFWPADTHFDFGRIDVWGDQRGGMLIQIAPDGTTTYKVLRAAQLLPDYNDIGIDYDAVKAQLIRKRGQQYVQSNAPQ